MAVGMFGQRFTDGLRQAKTPSLNVLACGAIKWLYLDITDIRYFQIVKRGERDWLQFIIQHFFIGAIHQKSLWI